MRVHERQTRSRISRKDALNAGYDLRYKLAAFPGPDVRPQALRL